MIPADFYRSRVVIAESGRQRGTFGPVHTADGLSRLERDLEAAGWIVRGHLKLISAAQLRAQPKDGDQ